MGQKDKERPSRIDPLDLPRLVMVKILKTNEGKPNLSEEDQKYLDQTHNTLALSLGITNPSRR